VNGDARLERLEAIEEIRRLKALYCHWADRGYDAAGDDAAEFAALFVEDAVWTGGKGVPVVGRAAIEHHYASFRPFGMHYVTNGEVEVDVEAGRATGHWHVLSPQTSHDGRAVWIAGTYDEEYVKTDDGWKFKRVQFGLAFRTPYEDGWARTQRVDY
jgi:uncharacterized protein (TIGR02246 family)